MDNTAKFSVKVFIKKIPNVIYLIVILGVIYAIFVPGFFKSTSLTNILFLSSISGVITVGISMIMMMGGIDLSAYGIVPFGGVLAARLMVDAGWPIALATLAAIAAGFVIGAIGGWFIGATGSKPFIITFATQAVTKGLALVLSNALPVQGLSKEFISIAKGSFIGIPTLFWIMLVIVMVFWVMLRYLRFGSDIYSVGGNEQVAHLEGIKVLKTKMIAYGISAALAAFAGVLYASRSYTAMPVSGSAHEFNAITAAVVGGISFSGGKGSVINATLGVIVVTSLKSALGMLSVSSSWQMFATGAIIIIALTIPVIQEFFGDIIKKAKRNKLNASDRSAI